MYVSRWEDEEGKMVDFERWDYKRISTVIKKLEWLESHPVYQKIKACRITIYDTSDGTYRPVHTMLRG